MLLIKKLFDMIEDELEGAECYAEKSLKYKYDDPTLAKMFYSMANDEMGHFEKLHFAISEQIEKHRKEHGDPPAEMQALYDFLHEKYIKQSTNINVMLTMYKE